MSVAASAGRGCIATSNVVVVASAHRYRLERGCRTAGSSMCSRQALGHRRLLPERSNRPREPRAALRREVPRRTAETSSARAGTPQSEPRRLARAAVGSSSRPTPQPLGSRRRQRRDQQRAERSGRSRIDRSSDEFASARSRDDSLDDESETLSLAPNATASDGGSRSLEETHADAMRAADE